MLSKKQARTFFLGGTILFSTVFIGLSIDSIGFQMKKKTNEQNLTEAVIRGKHVFDQNNCMGCHTILGEGAYYAPELTKVYERRGPQWIKMFVNDPQAMYPGQRKMVDYDFNEQELEDLVQFFKWVGEMDLNGFPPKPDLKKPTSHAAEETGSHTSSNLMSHK